MYLGKTCCGLRSCLEIERMNLYLIIIIVLGVSKCNVSTSTTGTPGWKISSKSSGNCPAGFIINRNGSCTNCPPGFQGKDCSNDCPDNYYGYRCLNSCNCTMGEVCDRQVGCTENQTGTYRSYETSSERYTVSPYSNTHDRTSATSSTGLDNVNTNSVSKLDVTVSSEKEEDRNIFSIYKPNLHYIVLGIIFMLIINICSCVMLKRYISKRSLSRDRNSDQSPADVESPSMGIETDSRETSHAHGGEYADIFEVQNEYADHAEDQYHVLSFSRNNRRTLYHHDGSIYHHLDIGMMKKEKAEPTSRSSSTSSRKQDQTSFSDVINREQVKDDISSISEFKNGHQINANDQEDTRPYSFALGCQDAEASSLSSLDMNVPGGD